MTTCSAKKKFPASISVSELRRGSQADVSQSWIRNISEATPQAAASEMYAGRAFRLALQAAKLLGADLAVVSAGLGFVSSTQQIPSYDLTLSRGGVRSHIDGKFDIHAWWKAISAGPFSSDVMDELDGREMVLVCVSSTYFRLISASLESNMPTNLRIFGAGISRILPSSLVPSAMPYDSRLSVHYADGLQTDFAQRALFHYASEIFKSPSSKLIDDKLAAEECFANASFAEAVPTRKQFNDSEIKAIIKRLLPNIGARKSAMLRHLRDVEVVACEQGRFGRLLAEVLAQ